MKTRPLRIAATVAGMIVAIGAVAYTQHGLALTVHARPATRPAPKAAAAITASCKIAGQSIAASSDFLSTSSATFTDMPGMSVTFKTTGPSTCLTVQFSAEADATAGSVSFIRAVLGKTISSQVPELSSDSIAGSHAFTFFFRGVKPGVHTVKMQWRTNRDAVDVYVETLVVFHG